MSQSRGWWAAGGTAGLIAVAAVIYFLLPVPGRIREGTWTVIFCCAMAVLAALILLSIVKLLRAGPGKRARGLIMLLCVAVLFFSWADHALAVIPGQFYGLHTKTDALYFSVSTLATVGFGDVHAAGQLARAAVTAQMLFNLVFLGTAVATVSGLIRTRANRRIGGQASDIARPAGPAGGRGSGSGS